MLTIRSWGSMLGAVALAAVACVINVGEDDCSKCDNAPRCHSHLDEMSGDCSCDPGHQWANPGNDNDFECRKIPPKPGTAECVEDNSYVMGDSCFCDDGYVWCSTDQMDLTCCVDENQATGLGPSTDTGTDTDATGGAESGGRVVELPECTAEIEGQLGCTNTDPMTPEPTMQCVGGMWVELDEDAHCQAMMDGDFAYGCLLEAMVPQVLCGRGPGSDCTDEAPSCIDGMTLHLCLFGRLTARNCEMFCAGPEQEGFDHGTCEADDCACCSESDGNCPP